MPLTDAQSALFEGKNLGYLATTAPDGSAQCTPVWVTLIDGKPAFNTAKGRAKHRNILAQPKVAIAIHSPENLYAYVEVQGTASEVDEDADARIDALAQKYLGQDRYPWHSDTEQRVTIVIQPERVSGM